MSWKLIRSVSFLMSVAVGVPMVMGGGCPPGTTIPTSAVPNTTTRPPGIYVGNINNSITVFPLDASGNTAPIRTISGPSTQLNLPLSMGMDSKSNLYVANRKNGLVTVYPGDANGDVAPTKTLSDPDMGSPSGLAVGPGDQIFVSTCPGCGTANGGQVGVFHFANNATQSDYRLGGATNANTGFTYPSSVSLDYSNPAVGANVIVGNSFGGKIQLFGPGQQGDQLPVRTLNPRSGANLQCMVFAGNALFLTIPGAIIDIYPGDALTNAPPSSTLPASPILPVQYPGGLFVDVSVLPPVGYLVDYTGNAVYVIKTIGTAPNLTVDSVTTIAGPATGLNGPLGVLVVKS